ncbi:MAG TPA: choice-of-anchor D domain-containing protein [Verrucomicrobiales bacterium]|nr:choice-of-anchor D domain-containing protein [Verrucomicrobiales bacterium]
MNFLRCPLRFVLCLCSGLAGLPPLAKALPVAAGSGPIGQGDASPAIVAGRPAIAWSSSEFPGVKFVRAKDETGGSWGPPVTVDSQTASGGHLHLFIANGNPAICYSEDAPGRLKFVRALDPAGAAWGIPQFLNTGGDIPWVFDAEIVDGRPAVCYIDMTGIGLHYFRAADPDGSAWGSPAVIDPVQFPFVPDLRVIAGRPAMVYTNADEVWYLRALDQAGASWPSRRRVAGVRSFNNRHPSSLEEVNGLPVITYFDADSGRLACSRAADAGGMTWKDALPLTPPGHGGAFTSLALIGGKPAIAFYDPQPGSFIGYLSALDAEGATVAAWEMPATVVSGVMARLSVTLLPVSGAAALVWLDEDTGDLNYLRAAGPASGTGWPADILIKDPGGAPIPEEGTLDFGNLAQDITLTLEGLIQNSTTGAAILTLESLTVDGPDAAEFTLLSPAGGTTLLPGEAVALRVQYTSTRAGVKSAVLHITSNAGNHSNPCNIVLTASSLPSVVIEYPPGTFLPDGGFLNLPLTPAGSSSDFTFTVRNPGVADLYLHSILLDGQHSSSFEIVSPPAGTVPPGGSTGFTLRHHSLFTGAQTATLHLPSNAGGSLNSYDITLKPGPPGRLDPAFVPAQVGFTTRLALQPNGRIITIGTDGIRNFNADGTTNNFFFVPAIHGLPSCLAVQKDGKILIGGEFDRVEGHLSPGIARVYPDGTIDRDFISTANSRVNCIAVQPDGGILIGGRFTLPGETSPRSLVRLSAGGAEEPDFHPVLNEEVLCLALQPDGKVIAGGRFEFSPRHSPVERFNADGTPDGTVFAYPFAAGDYVMCLAVQADGMILAGGHFAGNFRRFFPNGTVEPLLTVQGSGDVNDIGIQVDGRIAAAGAFHGFGAPLNDGIAQFYPNGSIVAEFRPLPNLPVFRLAQQGDGKLLMGGQFFVLAGGSRNGLARLDNDPAYSSLKATGPSAVRWMRGGSAPEVSDVTFDVRPPGSSGWTALGTATRIEGGWELTGLSLPASGSLRAQARSRLSVIETVEPLTPLNERWRVQYFNSSANAGDAADDADPDHDGLTNFAEFAFGLSPVDGRSVQLPAFQRSGPYLTASFTAPPGLDSLLMYSAEWSPSLLPGTWTAIPDTGTGGAHLFLTGAAGERVFVRYRVTVR